VFQHQNCLQHLLQPRHYTDPGHYQQEIERIFRPSWQFACTKQEVANNGDFITLELCGEPILIKNFDGSLRAFLNVCPHRHCMLTCETSGNQPGLVCQYHGWEFQQDGSTGKIPEARAFRPWDRENSHLHRVGLDSCGDLVFVCLDPANTPSLSEWASPLYQTLAEAFRSPVWRMAETWEFDCAANWKVPTENTLESYHVAAVHPKWLGDQLPEEKMTEHHLDGRYTTLRYACDSPVEKRQARICEYLGGRKDHSYRHWHIHPNIAFCLTDTFNYLATTQPTSPTTCRVRTRTFALHGHRRNPFAKLLRFVAWRIGRRTMHSVFNEDRAIYDAQQRGLAASRHRGVIGTREERVHVFQRYLCDKLQLDIEPDPAEYLVGSEENANSSDCTSTQIQS